MIWYYDTINSEAYIYGFMAIYHIVPWYRHVHSRSPHYYALIQLDREWAYRERGKSKGRGGGGATHDMDR